MHYMKCIVLRRRLKNYEKSLDHKYKSEKAGTKKFSVAKFLVDSKTVVNQVQELQLITHDIFAEGMIISDSFQVVVIIEKLPSTWNDFKTYLKYKRKEMIVEELIIRLQIEEGNKGAAKKVYNTTNLNVTKINLVKVKKGFKKRKQPDRGLSWDQKEVFLRSQDFKKSASNVIR